MKYEALFEPITIGNVEIKNRIACTPMCVAFEDDNGFVTEQFKAFYAARAVGGTGLIETGTVTVTKLHADRRTIGLKMLNTLAYPGLSELAETIHHFGAKLFMQVGTGQGRQVFSKKTWANPSLDVISASPVPYRIPHENYPTKADKWFARRGLSWMKEGGDEGLMPREATVEEIEETEDTVAASVPILKALGYDGIEVHAAHGYFAFSFLSPRMNIRTDKYGGSLENQFRFIKNMIEKSRKAVGDDFVIGVRLSLDEHMPGGVTLEHTKYHAQAAEKAGADYILFSDGCHEAYKHYVPDENGTMLDRAGEVKKLVKIPIITPSVHDPDMAEKAIRDGKTDLIGLARGLIAEPFWANKVARGEPIAKCSRCLAGCFTRLHLGAPIRCTENPEVGFEQYNPAYQMNAPAIPYEQIQVPPKKERPCIAVCPIGQDVAGYVGLIYDGKLKEAIELIRETNPLPGVLGRVCNHPCETECNRGKVDEPICIASLKRFATDYALNAGEEDITPVPQTRGDKVAIVGSGPAGLAAAWRLANMGYGVTIFEALSVAGGMLTVGIPEYRLPNKIIQADIERIKKLGVEINLNSPIGKDGLTLDELRNQGYKAIFLAVGAHTGQKLPLFGASLEGVMTGTSFLRDVNLGKKVKIGEKVLVLGGGNVAFDCARTALRLGAKEAHIACLESRDCMLAFPEEIKEGESEGIIIHPSQTFTRIVGDNGCVTGVECLDVKNFEFDWLGRLHVDSIAGSEHIAPADTIIFAVGQAPDLTFVPEDSKLQITRQGTLQVDPVSLATNIPGVFAGGDAVVGVGTVVEAVAAGKRAATAIDCYLQGKSLPPEPAPPQTVTIWELGLGNVKEESRSTMPATPSEKRVRSFEEVNLGFSKETAVKEADRCFNCSLRGWWGK